MVTLTTFGRVPPFARGFVRDVRVRWALEEAGIPYRTNLVGPGGRDEAGHFAQQPFGQVPVIEDDGLVLFESGAIVLHVARRSEALMPPDPAGRARAEMWVLAALSSIEIVVQPLVEIDLFHADEDWAKARREAVEQRARRRLRQLAARLDGREYLEDRFTAGDLMMATVLRELADTDLVAGDTILAPYLARCVARPAFRRALRDHMAVFESAGST